MQTPSHDAASIDLDAIEKRIDLMRWSERLDDDPPTPGSLSDQFWNHDLPALVSAARVSEGPVPPAPASRCAVGSPEGEVAAE